ncbi:MAG: hypothetical protein A2001_01490 [Treponema sp. GWC1_61_84]|nr:MAG: hypothetical protein A2001_01490 [Treponema sp. GWC1_61_84]
MLEREYSFFDDHREELLTKYRNKFIVIIGEEVVGIFESLAEAYTSSISKYTGGTFLIQEVLPFEQSIQRFHSLVYV